MYSLEYDIEKLRSMAVRIRRYIIEMTHRARSGHPGGSMSSVEILTALYFAIMRIDPARPDWEHRDRFVLSKGHASPVLYATLALRGYFPEEELSGFRRIDSMLQGHPDMKGTPGVEMSSGSLGLGFSAACGMAAAAKLDKKDCRVYALIGDGEAQEGIIWEASMAAAHYRLDNLTAFLDHNGLQIDGRNEEVISVEPLTAKWRAFGWEVLQVDGHSFEQITTAVERAKGIKGRPTIIIARTVKGKGVSYMEDKAEWHGKAPGDEDRDIALKELEVVCSEC
ncbi:MAG: transketolase [Firmicutes bacterium]|nr:transketolase [Bacillota bacterium]MDD3298388.1 transketolase [Bacillota bacterium]MDD3850697.1 transketolase [Bacillota bacterium]MDD4707912.1 transketolase [Bacillota bacterium]